MFIDASAAVAIVAREPGHATLEQAVKRAPQRLTSTIAVWEAAAALSRKARSTASDEYQVVMEFVKIMDISLMPNDLDICRAALRAFDAYGRRSGHPAQLNMGDCFAYACAKSRGIPLLFVGNDFSQTDVIRAVT